MTQFIELKCPKCEGELKHKLAGEYRCNKCNALFERVETETPIVPRHPFVIPYPQPFYPRPVNPYWPTSDFVWYSGDRVTDSTDRVKVLPFCRTG